MSDAAIRWRMAFALGAASDNFVEAVRAFNEKRAPRFTGV
jgi:enoyl-CoA hydratase/carnithine racemase